jgi:hypothetical protein
MTVIEGIVSATCTLTKGLERILATDNLRVTKLAEVSIAERPHVEMVIIIHSIELVDGFDKYEELVTIKRDIPAR